MDNYERYKHGKMGPMIPTVRFGVQKYRAKLIFACTDSGYSSEADDAKKLLVPGHIYRASRLNVGSSYSTVELQEFPDAWFNTVLFVEWSVAMNQPSFRKDDVFQRGNVRIILGPRSGEHTWHAQLVRKWPWQKQWAPFFSAYYDDSIEVVPHLMLRDGWVKLNPIDQAANVASVTEQKS